jgi:hypothetical protein
VSQITTPRAAAAFFLDLVALVMFLLIVSVSITGGGQPHIGGIVVGLRTTGNLIAWMTAAFVLRSTLCWRCPLLGRSRVTPSNLGQRSLELLARLISTPDDGRWVRRSFLYALLLSVVLQFLNLAHPGFYSGDDVEIQEMSLGPVLGFHWPIWNLRNSFYPMVFLHPVQEIAFRLGVTDVGHLILAGRLPVLLFSIVAVGLVYLIALRLTDKPWAGVLAALLFETSRLHLWFGASALPRPVAATFILAAFLLVLERGQGRAALAGLCLAVGGTLRFGELVFFLPAGIQLLTEKRFKELIALSTTGVIVSVTVLGVTDWLFWGRPFFSLINTYDFTVVKGLSTRGFQPFLYYFWSASDWIAYPVLALALSSVFLRDRRPAMWTIVPLAALSMLPHKEARYVVAVQPFACLAATVATVAIAQQLRKLYVRPEVTRGAALALVVAVLLSVVFEVSNWRFRRSDDAVLAARAVALTEPRSIAAPQLWRFGGHLYWRHVQTLIDLQTTSHARLMSLVNTVRPEWVLLPRNQLVGDKSSVVVEAGYAQVLITGVDMYDAFRRTDSSETDR